MRPLYPDRRWVTYLLFIVLIALALAVTATEAAVGDIRYNATPQDGVVTWYNGRDLNNAACYQDKRIDAKYSWYIGAVDMSTFGNHIGGNVCFECLRLTNGNKTVTIRLIDECSYCAKNQIDVTGAAYKELAPLKTQKISVKYQFIQCP
ncbi:MAG: RlpA-like double-psi beta-barrel-protein domain-containing protein-containing protein, partial [Linnemannia gamsii]